MQTVQSARIIHVMQDVSVRTLQNFAGLDGFALLYAALTEAFPQRIAVVSSFGTESAVLLALVAEIDPAVPVLFLDTGKHFHETLTYRDSLARRLGLRDVRTMRPDPDQVARHDSRGDLVFEDADGCCALRKVAPLEAGLVGFDAWVSGRKRFQAVGRAALPLVEHVDGRVKFNPLAHWTSGDLAREHVRRGLPSHPLSARDSAPSAAHPAREPLCPTRTCGRDAGPERIRRNAASTAPPMAGWSAPLIEPFAFAAHIARRGQGNVP